jgi:hypothetical protein
VGVCFRRIFCRSRRDQMFIEIKSKKIVKAPEERNILSSLSILRSFGASRIYLPGEL